MDVIILFFTIVVFIAIFMAIALELKRDIIIILIWTFAILISCFVYINKNAEMELILIDKTISIKYLDNNFHTPLLIETYKIKDKKGFCVIKQDFYTKTSILKQDSYTKEELVELLKIKKLII
jgi:hypothetical protein